MVRKRLTKKFIYNILEACALVSKIPMTWIAKVAYLQPQTNVKHFTTIYDITWSSMFSFVSDNHSGDNYGDNQCEPVSAFIVNW